MKLTSARSLAEMKNVLLDPNAAGPDPVYQVLDVSRENSWVNETVISHGKYGTEFPKTFGHYHGTPVPEIYTEVQGEGILLLQKKYFENGVWVPERVSDVFLIRAKHGDKIVITSEYGHNWSNIGDKDLVLYDDWHSGHQPSDYEMVQKLHGMAYYLTEVNGETKPVANSNYKDLPAPVWLTSAEFTAKQP